MAYISSFGGPKGCCDRCGGIYNLDCLRKEWTNLMVCAECWDCRHPQDYVRAVGPDRLPYARRAVGELRYVGTNEVTPDDL